MSAEKHRPQSIWFRLIAGLITVSLLGAAATSLLLYKRFVATNSAFRDRTLQNEARIISKLLRRAAEGRAVQFPDFLTNNFQEGKGKFAIISDNGVLVAGSPGVTGALAPVNDEVKQDFFLSEANSGGPQLYGISLRGTYGSRPVWIQVAVPGSDLVFDSILEDFMVDIGWIWIPFVFLLLATNLVVTRVSVRPLRIAATQAESIGPDAVSTRLPEEGLPREVHSLVVAVNRALDRLEAAFKAQQRFIADAAHELRTPVAVLKAHAGILPKFDEFDSFKEEIDAMERLVNQLLDAARIDSIKIDPGQRVDLNQVALSVASQLAPLAIKSGKSIELFPADLPVVVNGSYELLSCALRNLVDNAIRFTAPSTAVAIEVLHPPGLRVTDCGPGVKPQEREAIFQRFWQGQRDRGGGAGLGMDIVARTVSALGGSVSIDDAPDGGAVFTMRFPDAPHAALQARIHFSPQEHCVSARHEFGKFGVLRS